MAGHGTDEKDSLPDNSQ